MTTPTTDIAKTSMPKPEGIETQLVSVLPYAYWSLGERIQYAKFLAGAKELLPAGLRSTTIEDTAAKVFLVMETGAMLGLHPMAAFQGIDVIEGNATISPELGSALVRAAGHKLRKSESGTIRDGDYTVTWTLIRTDDPEPRMASWSLEDSVQAGLVELIGTPGQYKVEAKSRNGNPLNHEKYPKDMTQWRALGRLLRSDAADVTMGLGYFPEELQVALGAGETGSIHRDLSAEQDAIIAEFINDDGSYKFDDKADLAEVWKRHHARDAWPGRVEAAFDGALTKATKDTRESKPAAEIEPPSSDPTDYDDAESDGQGGVRSSLMEQAQRDYAASVVPEPDANEETVEPEPEPEPEPVAVESQPPVSEEEQLRLDAERADAAAAAEYEREHGPAKPKPAADMTALGGGKISPDDERLV